MSLTEIAQAALGAFLLFFIGSICFRAGKDKVREDYAHALASSRARCRRLEREMETLLRGINK